MSTKGFTEDDGVQSSFAELPVKAAYVNWTRGNAQLLPLKDTDPGVYFGGWKARLIKWGTENELNPKLPYPIAKRSTQKGDASFEVYATNVLHIITIATRTRWELRRKEKGADGKENTIIENVRTEKPAGKGTGYQPMQQVFGLAFNPTTDEHYPVVIKIDSWSAYISFQNASQAWKKVLKKVAPGKTIIRRYGSVGKNDKSGNTSPNFETFGDGYSTPIEAIDVNNPRLRDIDDELEQLQKLAQDWKNDPLWNRDGKISKVDEAGFAAEMEEILGDPFLSKFADRAKELRLTNLEIESLLKSVDHDYEKAYDSIKSEEVVAAGGNVDLGNPFQKPE